MRAHHSGRHGQSLPLSPRKNVRRTISLPGSGSTAWKQATLRTIQDVYRSIFGAPQPAVVEAAESTLEFARTWAELAVGSADFTVVHVRNHEDGG